MPFPELRAEALQQPDLLLAQLQLALTDLAFQPQQAFVLGQQPMAAPHSAHAAGADLDPLQRQLLCHPQRTLGRVLEAVVQDRRLYLGVHPVGVRALRARQLVQQAIRPVELEIYSNFIKLLARTAHDLAGLADIRELGSQL